MQMDYSIFSRFRNFKLFAGYSGGSDSTALLLLAARGAAEYQFELTAVHFNHHLRGAESDREAANAEKFAGELGVKFLKIDLDIPDGSNLEARAREARMAKFRELAGDDPRAVVLLGHHADDRVENMFLRLLRGSNVSGLTSIRQECIIGGVRIFRPLTGYTKSQIENFLRENGIGHWASDSSNADDVYARNFFRNKLLPQISGRFPHAQEALRISLNNLEQDADFLEMTAGKMLAGNDPALRSFWQSLHPALLVRCLRLFLDGIFGEKLPVSRESVNRFKAMIDSGGQGKLVLDETRVLILDETGVIPCLPPPEKVSWQWRSEPQIFWGKWRFRAEILPVMPEHIPLTMACFDAENFPGTVFIGAAESGEKMLPFGRRRPVKVKELRIKRGVAPYPENPVLRDVSGRILWLPGIRHSGVFTCRPEERILVIYAEKC